MPVFSSRTIRPAPRRANCQAMLAPEHPPPITTTSATSATHDNPAVTGERCCVFAVIPTQPLVLLGRRRFKEAASAGRWQAGPGQVSPHLGKLEAGQHAIDDWCTRRLRGARGVVGEV